MKDIYEKTMEQKDRILNQIVSKIKCLRYSIDKLN